MTVKIDIKSVRLKINMPGWRALRRNPQADAELRRRALSVARAAGPGWKVIKGRGRNRARYLVVPTTAKARRESIKEMAPLRALDQGRR